MNPSPPPHSSSRFAGFFAVAALTAVALAAAELAARIDDWFFDAVPLFSNPSYADLFTTRADGIRVGVPGARWKSVRLNQFGLRGPDVAHPRPANCQRWLFLGASETFGEPSIPDGDYPSTVRHGISGRQCIEVLNGSFPGLDLPTIARWYEAVLSDLDADVVFVLAPTHLYLADNVRAKARNPLQTEQGPTGSARIIGQLRKALNGSRLLERIRDSAEVPTILQRLRTQRWIDKELALHPRDWLFDDVPTDRLDALQQDLSALTVVIRSHGAEPILITHPVRSSSPPRPEDHPDLFAMRTYVPRAPEVVIAEFEYEAAERTRIVGEAMGVEVVDAARTMSGHRELFIDLVHYSEQGRDTLSALVLSALLQNQRGPDGAL